MNQHEKYMQRCLQLAQSGLGYVAPNPMVGCVIVHNDKIIGEGFHHQFGGAHAEVNAINSVAEQHLLSTSSLYVNLEPCVHFGKTPPCTDLIIEKKIPQVIVGCTDVFKAVNGKGIEKLKVANIDVVVNVLKNESLKLNKRFFTYHQKKRPYIILKWAQSADGFIASKNPDVKDDMGRSVEWISNLISRNLVHKWRSEEQAIMIGTNTALKDNPFLNVRNWKGNNPVRMVLDKNLRLPANLNLFDKYISSIVFTSKEKTSEYNLEFIKINFNNVLNELMNHLYRKQIQSLIVEGGSELINSFIINNYWDEARILTANKIIADGIAAPHLAGKINEVIKIGSDQLTIIKNEEILN